MSKHGIIGRVAQLARADIGAMVAAAPDPQVMLERLRRDYTATTAEAGQAVAQLVTNLRVAEDDQREDAAVAVAWSKAAEAASQQADELRASGDAGDADLFDGLAMVALERQLIAENDVETSRHTTAAQRESVARLTDGLGQLTARLADLERTQATMTPAPSSETTQWRVSAAVEDDDVLDPARDVARFDAKLRREGARARGAGAMPASPQDAQFAGLSDPRHRPEIEERLKSLKAGRAMAAAKAKIEAQAHDQPFR
jgi:phage shock protein A